MQAAAAASHLVARLQEDGRLHRAASAGRRTCRAAASSRAGSAWLAADGLRSAEVCCRQSCAEGALPDATPPRVPAPCSSPRCVGFRSPKTRLLRASVHRAWPLHRRDRLEYGTAGVARACENEVSRHECEEPAARGMPSRMGCTVQRVRCSCACVRVRACACTCVCARVRREGGREGGSRGTWAFAATRTSRRETCSTR